MRPVDVEPEFRAGDALVVVDVQRDFCAGGALPIPDGDAVVPLLNRWLRAADAAGIPIFVSRDLHPTGHVSFVSSGGRWPPHCVQGTPGAELHPDLEVPASARGIAKGVRFDKDQNSVFDETGLASELRRLGVRRLWVGGLAQDVCVRDSVMDALQQGLEVTLILDATRPTDAAAGERALARMRAAGAGIATTP